MAVIVIFYGISYQAEREGNKKDVSDELPTPENQQPVPIYEVNYTNTSDNEIIVLSPKAGDNISSPLAISGQAKGSWFFEATAPVDLVDWDGRIIASGYITAQADWMTEEFVDFTGELVFDNSGAIYPRGALILRADNPSGLPQFDRAVEIPIMYAK